MSFLDEITPLKEAALRALQAADTLAKLDDVRVQYLGTNGRPATRHRLHRAGTPTAAWQAAPTHPSH